MPSIRIQAELTNAACRNVTIIAQLQAMSQETNFEQQRTRATRDATRHGGGSVTLIANNDDRLNRDMPILTELAATEGVNLIVGREEFQTLIDHAQQRLINLRLLQAALFENTLANV